VCLAKVDVKKQIIELSVKHGIISKYTSFVAVEERKNAVQGEMKLRRVSTYICVYISLSQQPMNSGHSNSIERRKRKTIYSLCK
jgi:hypothetical protein